MFVRDRMSHHPITVTPDTSLHEALKRMHEEHVRRLPVLDRHGKLVGIVNERDLLYASPSPATSLSVYELNYLVSRVLVSELMTKTVITVTEDTPLEEAARIMEDNDISGLPVMRGDTLVGMITESDLFKIFLEMLGARAWGLRISLKVADKRGVLATITREISDAGGNIVALGTFWGDDPTSGRIAMKVQGIEKEKIEEIMQDIDAEITDIRETK